ncbi:uncharacterized protein LOC123566670 [Mercenaria mercenaria]|uniref:uncharacterized protein LOC123566670 n=1 Tax=Mercenaria mercenaria TaxID=6596 RepID=UPI00234EDDC0|nr:uncharacterized protein LOC123566670 [Mercenaria mercenaria]
MAHPLYLSNEKYRQWLKAGLGLRYLKEGLAPFCEDVAKQQHKDILDNIKQTKILPTVTCGQCAVRTLKPDHVKIGKNKCPLGQANCNCCCKGGKIACPNNVCGAIYDNIITNHASVPPAPNWKNTQSQQWTVDPWSIAKCFINVSGYDLKTSAADIDCTGLLHVIINNKYFHNHITGTDVFSKVRKYRSEIFRSSTMELENANTYIDDMIAVLQDGKELIYRKDAKEAVKKLQEVAPANFDQYAAVVPPQPAPGPVPQPAPVPQHAPVPQQAQMTPKRALAPQPDPAEVVPAPVVPVGIEHLQCVLDQGTGFRLLSFDAMSNDQLQMVPTARAGMGLHVSTPIKNKATQTSRDDTEQSIVSEYDSDGRTGVNRPELKDKDKSEEVS